MIKASDLQEAVMLLRHRDELRCLYDAFDTKGGGGHRIYFEGLNPNSLSASVSLIGLLEMLAAEQGRIVDRLHALGVTAL